MAGGERPHSKWYLHHLDTHIQASLKATVGNHHLPSLHLPQTDIPPSNTTWTSPEKDSFFAALSRHSKYRPDLIAGDVGKSELEVVWYLEFLEREKAAMVNKKKRESRMKELKGSSKWREGLAPAAREVSGKWIEREEELVRGLDEVLEGMAQEHALSISRKRKRDARRSVIEKAVIPPDSKPGDKSKFIDKLPEMQKLNQQWDAEDWLAVMNPEKLDQLDDCIQKVWLAETQEELVRNADQDDAESPLPPASSTTSKTAIKVARDLQTISLISPIPKKHRTPEQQRLITVARNRQRGREKYRTKKLLDEGMTAEDIRKAGGADAVFAQKQGHGVSVDVGLDVGQKRPEMKEVYDYVNEAGLDVFAFANMIHFLASHGLPIKTTSVSLPILQELREELVIHLQSLLYDVITIAETETLQAQPGSDDDRDKISSHHVQQALALRGDLPPWFIVDPALFRILLAKADRTKSGSTTSTPDADEDVSENEAENAVNEASEAESLVYYPANVLPPASLSWSNLPHLSHNSGETPYSGPASAVMDEDEDDNVDEDEEEMMLDEALHEVDMEHDEIYEKGLWDVHQDDEGEASDPDDQAEVWAKDPGERSAREQAYAKVYVEVCERRRKRRLVAHRDSRFARSSGSRRGKVQSKAFVADSSEEEDEVGSGDDEDAPEGSKGDDESADEGEESSP
ncbi:hypothetical protein IAR50_004678 [Cryptococcus sp. DSM 104548]